MLFSDQLLEKIYRNNTGYSRKYFTKNSQNKFQNKMFTGNILEYNSLFNIQVKTCAWFDLSLNEVNNVNHLQLWQKVKRKSS